MRQLANAAISNLQFATGDRQKKGCDITISTASVRLFQHYIPTLPDPGLIQVIQEILVKISFFAVSPQLLSLPSFRGFEMVPVVSDSFTLYGEVGERPNPLVC